MNTTRHLIRPVLLGLLLTLGSSGYAVAACTPTAQARCWYLYDQCIVYGNPNVDCEAQYFNCLDRHGCG